MNRQFLDNFHYGQVAGMKYYFSYATKFCLALVLLICSALPAFAQNDGDLCAPYPDVPVTVTPVMGDTSFDYATDITGLKSLKSSTSHFYERLLLGITSYTPDIQVINHPQSVTTPEGLACVRIMSVEVKINYQDIVIHVASEIPEGTCGFDEVVAHEQRHIAIEQQVLQEYTPLIQQKLHDYLKIYGVIQERNYGYAMTVIHDNMNKAVKQSLAEMQQQELARQQEMDSNQTFQEMSRTCNGQLAQIARLFHLTGK